MTHGTATGYRQGCRCTLCRDAHRNQAIQHRRSWKQRTEDAPHGTPGGYNNWGCRCEACREAQMAAQRERRLRRANASTSGPSCKTPGNQSDPATVPAARGHGNQEGPS